MSDSDQVMERIDLGRADDPRDVVHRVVAELAQGGSLGLADSGGIRLAALALHPRTVEGAWSTRASSEACDGPVVLLRGVEEARDWAPGVDGLALRLMRRAWPGPVVFTFGAASAGGLARRLEPSTSALFDAPSTLALNVPETLFLREVIRLLPGPLILGSASADALPESCRLIVDDPTHEGVRETWVRVDERGWSILAPGNVGESEFERMAATSILFVCTGNTCRSPMAEALCKVVLADRLGCGVGELPARGFIVESAGIAAIAGMPAASNALDVVRARGGSLQGHSSRRLSLEALHQADYVLAMTADHLDALRDHAPDATNRMRLLHPNGADVADPVGADRPTYQKTAREIESYLITFVDALLASKT